MNFLIDTNIFIYLEDYKIINDSYARFYQLCLKYNHNLYIHPISLEDISKDKDERRKEISFSKVSKYTRLDRPPLPSLQEIERLNLKESSDNDRIDNIILYALYKNCVNILLTQDTGIMKKARQLGIDHRVMFIQQALNTLRNLHEKHEVFYPTMVKRYLYELNKDDEIFQTLKEDYYEFNEWYSRVSRERRECWIHRYDGDEKIGGILIYKEENDPIVTLDNTPLRGKTLKISTFKIAEYTQGLKLGELFIKTIFDYANQNDFKYIYLTTRSEKQEYLVNLLEDFGFYHYGRCDKNRDDVYVKEVGFNSVYENSISLIDFYKKYSPSMICKDAIKKFLVPIQPTYHNMLFPEIEDNKRLFYTHPSVGNTIKKAYLSHSNTKNINSGDLLLFYRSHDKKVITSLGIVEKMFISDDINVILEEVAKRTVFSYLEIKKMAEKEMNIILFRLVGHFDKPFITKKWLEEHKLYKSCQSICSIENDMFQTILDEGNLNYCIKEE